MTVTNHKATLELGGSVQIVDGKPTLIYANASLITNADTASEGGCLRKVWFERVGGREREETDAQKAGTDMHAEIEHYELTGENVLSPLAAAGRHFIPKVWQAPHLFKVEHPMVRSVDKKITRAWLYADETPAAGHIDLVNLSGYYTDENGELRKDDQDVAEVLDHKSTAGLQWAKTAKQVADTIQMNTYGAWLLRWAGAGEFTYQRDHVERVRFTHISYSKKKPHAAQLSTSIRTAEQIEEKWKYATSIVRTIKDAIKETEAIKVPGNKKACYAYRSQCPHLGVCSIGSHDSLEGLFNKIASDFKLPDQEEQATMGILSDMNLTPVPAQPTAATSPALVPAPVLPPQVDMKAQLQAEEERLRAQQQAMQQQPPIALDIKGVWQRIQQHSRGTPQISGTASDAIADASNIARAPGGFGGTGDLARVHISKAEHLYDLLNELEQAAAKNGANPNAAQIIPVQVVQAPPPPPPLPTPVTLNTGAVMSLMPPDAPALNVATATVTAENAPTAEPKKRGPGRPKKDEPSMANIVSASAPEQTQATVASTPTPPAAPVAAGADALSVGSMPTGQPAKRMEVYINCLPMHRAKPLNGYIDMINAELSKRYCVDENGQPTIQDIRCAPKSSVLAYGGWKGAVHEIVRKHPPADDVYSLITGGDELADVVADAMRAVCTSKNGLYARGLVGR